MFAPIFMFAPMCAPICMHAQRLRRGDFAMAGADGDSSAKINVGRGSPNGEPFIGESIVASGFLPGPNRLWPGRIMSVAATSRGHMYRYVYNIVCVYNAIPCNERE